MTGLGVSPSSWIARLWQVNLRFNPHLKRDTLEACGEDTFSTCHNSAHRNRLAISDRCLRWVPQNCRIPYQVGIICWRLTIARSSP